MGGSYTGCIYSVVGGHFLMRTRIWIFILVVNTDLDPDHTTSFTHIGKSEIFNIFSIFLSRSVSSASQFSLLWIVYYNFFCKKYVRYSLSLLCVEMDTVRIRIRQNDADRTRSGSKHDRLFTVFWASSFSGHIVWIWIRRSCLRMLLLSLIQCGGSVTFWCGFVHLNNVSGSCYFRHWPSRRKQKTFFTPKFFCLGTFLRYIYIIFTK